MSQAYREWGLGELETNRDFYGNARFDDIGFQLSSKGQELQARFVQSYADVLHHEIEDGLRLPQFAPVDKPAATSPSSIRRSAGSISISAPEPGPNNHDAADAIATEVSNAQGDGKRRVGSVQKNLSVGTRNVRGASAEAADAVKEW